MTLKPTSSRLSEISSVGMAGRKMTNYCLVRLFGIWGEGKIVDIIFLQVEFHG
jgi:hypothetical protein